MGFLRAVVHGAGLAFGVILVVSAFGAAAVASIPRRR